MTITMKTADHLSGRAAEIAAIAEALYEAGFRREGDELARAAQSIALVANSMGDRLETYAATALRDDTNEPKGSAK